MVTRIPTWVGLCQYCHELHDLWVACPAYRDSQRRADEKGRRAALAALAALAAELTEREAMMEAAER